MKEPRVNLGQSLFQDTWFVANQQLTPFRQLRQLELEIKSIRDSIAKADFDTRKANIKYIQLVNKLNAIGEVEASSNEGLEKELIKIEMDELSYNLNSSKQLKVDALMRIENFTQMKDQLLEKVPQEYWDIGFENSESDYWKMYIAKQLSLSALTGMPNQNILDQMMMMPEDYVGEILQLANNTTKNYIGMNQKYLPKADEVNEVKE